MAENIHIKDLNGHMRLMAEREDESDIEVIRKKIPSIRLTRGLLEELVEIIDREYKDIKSKMKRGILVLIFHMLSKRRGQ